MLCGDVFWGGQNGTDSMKQPTQKCKCSTTSTPVAATFSQKITRHTTRFFLLLLFSLSCPVVSLAFVDCNSCSYIFICWFYLHRVRSLFQCFHFHLVCEYVCVCGAFFVHFNFSTLFLVRIAFFPRWHSVYLCLCVYLSFALICAASVQWLFSLAGCWVNAFVFISIFELSSATGTDDEYLSQPINRLVNDDSNVDCISISSL